VIGKLLPHSQLAFWPLNSVATSGAHHVNRRRTEHVGNRRQICQLWRRTSTMIYRATGRNSAK